MDNKIFREKSLQRVSSPEELNDYMKVTTPKVWVILAVVLSLLVGAIVWGIFGSITMTDANGNQQEVNPIHFIIN